MTAVRTRRVESWGQLTGCSLKLSAAAVVVVSFSVWCGRQQLSAENGAVRVGHGRRRAGDTAATPGTGRQSAERWKNNKHVAKANNKRGSFELCVTYVALFQWKGSKTLLIYDLFTNKICSQYSFNFMKIFAYLQDIFLCCVTSFKSHSTPLWYTWLTFYSAWVTRFGTFELTSLMS